MPPRSETLPAGVHKITNLLARLNATPPLKLTGLKCLRLTLASQNDHFGARHFVNENLLQIRWANPTLDIQVHRERKSKGEEWKAEMELEFTNGKVQKVDVNNKLSTTILKELMDTAGGDPWKRHVQDCAKSGQSLFPEDDAKTISIPKSSSKALPSLAEFLTKHPEKKAEHVRKESTGKKPKKKTTKTQSKLTS